MGRRPTWTAAEDDMILRAIAAAPKGPKGRVVRNGLAGLYRRLPNRTAVAIQVRAQHLLGPVVTRENRPPQPPTPAAAPAATPRVGKRWADAGIPGPRQARRRPCLCCGQEFNSEHAGNRLCSRCRTKSTGPFDL